MKFCKSDQQFVTSFMPDTCHAEESNRLAIQGIFVVQQWIKFCGSDQLFVSDVIRARYYAFHLGESNLHTRHFCRTAMKIKILQKWSAVCYVIRKLCLPRGGVHCPFIIEDIFVVMNKVFQYGDQLFVTSFEPEIVCLPRVSVHSSFRLEEWRAVSER